MSGLLRRLAARSLSRLPASAGALHAAVRSLAGDGPRIGLPQLDRVLVIAPHPDDETIACGGSVALLAADGVPVTVAVITDGEAGAGGPLRGGDVGRLRRGETVSACRVLGIDDLRFLGLADGRLEERRDDLETGLRDLVQETRPEVVVLPWFGDDHPDHRAANRALGSALAAAQATAPDEVWGAEVWTPVPVTRLVDISAVVDRKRAALAEHATPGEALDLGAALGLNRYRSLHGLRGRGYAEAFFAAPVATYFEASATFHAD